VKPLHGCGLLALLPRWHSHRQGKSVLDAQETSKQREGILEMRSKVIRFVGILLAVTLCPEVIARASAATNLFAVVSQAGALTSGNGVANVVHLGTGQYEVTFTVDVSQCAYIATTTNFSAQATQAFTAGGHLGVYGVYVETKNQGGGLTDAPFNLVVACSTTGIKYAVIDYAGNMVRSTLNATLTPMGAGRYMVTFASSVAACAYLATVADPGNGLVYAPSGVYTASGSNGSSVYIETKNPGGGLQSGVPFHLAVICNSTKSKIAVVDASGLPKRASALTGSYQWATGDYLISTSMNVTPACAIVATRGSVDTAVPFAPATAEIVPAPAANTMAIQLRDLLFFGGNKKSNAFHAAAVCK
jgi:hypothetical protein